MSARCSTLEDSATSLQGIGVGLRAPHVKHILKTLPSLDWFELLADNHISQGGWPRRQALLIAEQYPVTMHCVGMSIGSVDHINFSYLDKIKILASEIKPKIISDHLCWTSLYTHYSHDLLPLPYTEESLHHLVERIAIIQDYLGVQIAIENVSAYLTYKHSSIAEVEFINALANQADCNIVLDVNNVFVNQKNNGQDPQQYLDHIEVERVAEIHLAGFEDKGNYYLDAHNNIIDDDVWELYESLISRCGKIATLIEWDHDIPEFSMLYKEAMKAKAIADKPDFIHGESHEFHVAS